MRDVDPEFMAALANAAERGLVPRKMLSVTGSSWSEADTSARVSFWSGFYNEQMTVVSGVNGQPSSRLFYGGVSLQVGSIPRVADLTIQTVSIAMNVLADPVAQLVRGMDIRLAKVEIWDMLLNPVSRLPVSTPQLVFLGEVDGSPVTTPSIDGEETVEIRCVSDAISMLMRQNHTKSSYEAQKARGGDEWGKYASVVKNWRMPWGQKR